MYLPSGFSIRTYIVIAAHLLANEISTIVAYEQVFDIYSKLLNSLHLRELPWQFSPRS